MMLVKCRSDVRISLACLMWFDTNLDHGIIGTELVAGIRTGR